MLWIIFMMKYVCLSKGRTFIIHLWLTLLTLHVSNRIVIFFFLENCYPWKGGKKTDKLFSNSRMPFRENWKKNIREKPKKKKKKIVGLAMVEKWRVSRSARHWASSVLSCYDRNHYKCDRFIYKDSLLYSKYIYSSIPYFEPGCGSRWKKN